MSLFSLNIERCNSGKSMKLCSGKKGFILTVQVSVSSIIMSEDCVLIFTWSGGKHIGRNTVGYLHIGSYN